MGAVRVITIAFEIAAEAPYLRNNDVLSKLASLSLNTLIK